MYLGLGKDCVRVWVLRGQTPCCVRLGRPRQQNANAQHFFVLCEIRSHPECSPKPGKDVEVRADEN